MQIKYCIECQEDVIVEDGMEGHTVLELCDGMVAVDFCEGPFASCETPVSLFDEDSWELVEEPTQEELAIMNVNAEVLYQDFDYEDLKF